MKRDLIDITDLTVEEIDELIAIAEDDRAPRGLPGEVPV